VTEPSVSAAAAALSTLHENARRAPGAGHTRVSSWPTPPIPSKTVPSAPAVPTRSYSSTGADGLFPVDRVQLTLYTYKASTGSSINTQPSPLPSTSTPTVAVPSVVFFSYAALPWTPFPGDYLEIRRIRRPDVRAVARTRGMGGEAPQVRMGGEALRGVMKNAGRDGYVFKVGENATNVPVSQIQVPESVAAAFKLQHRTDMEVVRVSRRHMSAFVFCLSLLRSLLHHRRTSTTSSFTSPSISVALTCGVSACRSRTRLSTLAKRSPSRVEQFEPKSTVFGEVLIAFRVESSPRKPRRFTGPRAPRCTSSYSCVRKLGSSTRTERDTMRRLFTVSASDGIECIRLIPR